MADIAVQARNSGTPQAGLSPTITIFRLADNAVQLTAAAMSFITGSAGGYKRLSVPNVDGEEYYWEADLDPGGATLGATDRFSSGVYSGTTNTRIETDIPTIPADVDTALSVTHGGAGWEGTENTRPHLGVGYISVGTQLRIAVHAVRDGVRVTPTAFSLTWRNPDGTTLFSLTEVSVGVVLDVDDVFRVTLTQALTDGFLYRPELSVTDVTGVIGPRVITVGVSS